MLLLNKDELVLGGTDVLISISVRVTREIDFTTGSWNKGNKGMMLYVCVCVAGTYKGRKG